MNPKESVLHASVAAVFLSLLLLPETAWCQNQRPWLAANLKTVNLWTSAQRNRYTGNTNIWIIPGLVANREAHKIELLSEATGLDGGSTTEFLLVSPGSEKDYEALAISYVHASDVVHAMDFIGIPRGQPVNPSLCQFWPKGERIQATLRKLGDDQGEVWSLQSCVVDKRGMPVPDTFVATSSSWTGNVASAACVADQASPGAIISTYNERTTVMDVPSHSPQGEVYTDIVIAPDRHINAGSILVMGFSPVPCSDGRSRSVDVALHVCPGSVENSTNLTSLTCVTSGKGLFFPAATNTVAGTFERLANLLQEKHDPFVSLSVDDRVTVGAMHDFARVLKAVEGEGGIRMEAPPAGQLYYKAFLPDERWRTRADRSAQPWEVHLARNKDGSWRYMLIHILENWSKEGQLTPELTVREYPLEKGEEIPPKIKEVGGGINALFVFAPADAPLAVFMPAVRLLKSDLPLIYVFCE